MAKTGKYFTFELCLLSRVKGISTPDGLKNALGDYIITRGCEIAGKGFDAKNVDYVAEGFLEAREPDGQGFDGDNEIHKALATGAEVTNTRLGSYERHAKNLENIAEFLFLFEKAHGTDIKVRLRADIVWGFLGGKGGLTARDIVVYCAILGITGSDPYKWITKSRIRAAAHGYKSEAVLKKELPDQASHWITPDQVRAAEGRLEKKGFITSAIKGRRKAYSTRLPKEKLSQRINSDIANKRRIEENRKPARITPEGSAETPL